MEENNEEKSRQENMADVTNDRLCCWLAGAFLRARQTRTSGGGSEIYSSVLLVRVDTMA